MKELKRKLEILIWIVFFWMCYALILFTYDFLQKALPSSEFKMIQGEYNLVGNLFGYIFGGLVGALMLGILDLFFVGKYIKRHSILFILTIKSFAFVILYIVITICISFVYNMNVMQKDILDPAVFEGVRQFIFSGQYIGNFLLWSMAATLTFYMIQINYIFGPGTMLRFLAGKYQKPQVVERIFMFLDISDSTTIAEQLGHHKFFEFIQDFMFDINTPVLNHSGEIYKYVGDEVIISWSIESGLRHNQCINVFFAIRDQIKQSSQNYKEKFGMIPQFRAGAHSGSAMVGEIGQVKKEIAYSGDLLNTTARIQSECKKQDESFIISQTLLNQIQANIKTNDLGNILLKGKAEKLRLFAVLKRISHQ